MRTLADAHTIDEIIAFVKQAWPDESLRPNPEHHYGAWAAWTRQKMYDHCQQTYGEQISVHNFLDRLWRPITNSLGAASTVNDEKVWQQFMGLLEKVGEDSAWRHYNHPMMEQVRFCRCRTKRTPWATSYKSYVFGVDLAGDSNNPAFMQSLQECLTPQEKNALSASERQIELIPSVFVLYQWLRGDSFEYRRPVSKDRKQVTAVSRRPFPNVSVPPPMILRPVPAVKEESSLDEWFPRCARCDEPLEHAGAECPKCKAADEAAPKKQMGLWDA